MSFIGYPRVAVRAREKQHGASDITVVGGVAQGSAEHRHRRHGNLWRVAREGEVCAEIRDAPGAFDVWIPFFMEIPDAPPPDLTTTTVKG
jgi:hypothetical protein